MIASFLTPMLRLNPEKRAKASELIHHAWLDGVVVQGEIDIIRRAEDEEARKKRAAAQEAAAATAASHQPQEEDGEGSGARMAVDTYTDADADAMTPVEDDVRGAEDVQVPTIAAPVPGVRNKGEVPTLQAVPGAKGKA